MPLTQLDDPFVSQSRVGHHHDVEQLLVGIDTGISLDRGEHLFGLPQVLGQFITQCIGAVHDDERFIESGQVCDNSSDIYLFSAADFNDDHLPKPH